MKIISISLRLLHSLSLGGLAKLLVVTGSIAALAGWANASAVIYEPFNYPDGGPQLNGNAGGTGLSGTWSAGNNYNDNGGTGLTWGSLGTQGAAAKLDNGWSVGEIGVDSSTSYNNLLADGGELWFSVIYNNTASDQRSLFALSSVGIAGGNGRLESDTGETSVGIGFGRASDGMFYSKIWDDDNTENSGRPVWGNNNLTGSPESHDSASGNGAPVGTNFVVGHVQWGASGTDLDTIDLYLPGTDLVLGDVVSTSSGVIADQSGLDFLGLNSLRSSNESEYSIFDEIRVGASYADVSPVPEPRVALICCLGLPLLLRRRRCV